MKDQIGAIQTEALARSAAFQEKQLAQKNIATKSPSMKLLGTILLILLTVLALLFAFLIIALDGAHDNALGIFELAGLVLVPGILVVATFKRLTKT